MKTIFFKNSTLKTILCFALITSMLVFAAGCGGTGSADKSTSDTGTADTITIVDQADNTVEVPSDIQRIVVTDILPIPSVLAVFFNSAEKIVGMAPSSMNAAKNSLLSELYPEILNASTEFASGGDVNIEELAALNPDIVIYNASSTDLGQKLRDAGFNAVAMSVNKWNYDAIETLNNWIDLLSQMFPGNSKIDKCKEYSQKNYDFVQERVAGLSDEERARLLFLFQYDENTIVTSGKNFFGQYWADAVGAKNVGEELTQDNSIAVNMEQVYSWNPDTIMITNFTTAYPDDLYNNTIGTYDWSGIQAVQDENAFKMPLGMYRSYTPGVDTPVTLLWIAKSVYPELFADVNITDETKAYYKDVFGIELTDEQADKIFNPAQAAGVSQSLK